MVGSTLLQYFGPKPCWNVVFWWAYDQLFFSSFPFTHPVETIQKWSIDWDEVLIRNVLLNKQGGGVKKQEIGVNYFKGILPKMDCGWYHRAVFKLMDKLHFKQGEMTSWNFYDWGPAESQKGRKFGWEDQYHKSRSIPTIRIQIILYNMVVSMWTTDHLINGCYIIFNYNRYGVSHLSIFITKPSTL